MWKSLRHAVAEQIFTMSQRWKMWEKKKKVQRKALLWFIIYLIHSWCCMSYTEWERLFGASSWKPFHNYGPLLAPLFYFKKKKSRHSTIMCLMAASKKKKKEKKRNISDCSCWIFRLTVLASDSHSSSYRWWMVVMWLRIEAIAVLLPEEAIIFVSFVDLFPILMPHFCASVSR